MFAETSQRVHAVYLRQKSKEDFLVHHPITSPCYSIRKATNSAGPGAIQSVILSLPNMYIR